MARKIQSPGVEMNEIDISPTALLTGNTNVYITGFASQGPTDEVVQLVGGIAEFEQIFGLPTTAAERYFYYTVKRVADTTSAAIYLTRLPYGAGGGNTFNANTYGALVYPMVPVSRAAPGTALTSFKSSSTTDLSYFIGEPIYFNITQEEYQSILSGGIEWSDTPGTATSISTFADFGKAGFVVLDKSNSTLNNKYEGYYIGLTDNANVNPDTAYDSIAKIFTRNTNTNTKFEVPAQRLGFKLTSPSTSTATSLSSVVEGIASYDIFNDQFRDVINLGVFKIRRDPTASDPNVLTYVLQEKYTGSFDSARQLSSANGGAPRSLFLETVTQDSNLISVYVNSNISTANGPWQNSNSIPTKSVRVLSGSNIGTNTVGNSYLETEFDVSAGELFTPLSTLATAVGKVDVIEPISVYADYATDNKDLGTVPSKLERVLRPLYDKDLYDVDLVLEAGLGTIWVGAKDQWAGESAPYVYDDTKSLSEEAYADLTVTGNYTTEDKAVLTDYMSIASVFIGLCKDERKDCLFIADSVRQITVQGKNFKTLANKTRYFSKHIYWPLRHQFELINTSFVAAYIPWAKVYDAASDQQVWVPFSGFAGSIIANTPNKWNAPAGFNYGLISGVNDISYTPSTKENDQLYNISLNAVRFFPRDGYVLWGQKTKQAIHSVLDRIAPRMTLFFLEKATSNVTKNFVFQNNTFFTRQQVINVLNPVFASVKNGIDPGLYDYKIVCNESNNTPSVIDDNTLVIDIAVKLTRQAEFIVVNMITTRTDQNFSEILPG